MQEAITKVTASRKPRRPQTVDYAGKRLLDDVLVQLVRAYCWPSSSKTTVRGGKTVKNEKLYREAIEIASRAEERFLEAHEKNRAVSPELRERHREMFVQPAAAEACAQQSLIAALFGVSDERVHEDITNLLAGR